MPTTYSPSQNTFYDELKNLWYIEGYRRVFYSSQNYLSLVKNEQGQSIIDVLILKIISPSKGRKSRSQIINHGKHVKCCTATALNDFCD